MFLFILGLVCFFLAWAALSVEDTRFKIGGFGLIGLGLILCSDFILGAAALIIGCIMLIISIIMVISFAKNEKNGNNARARAQEQLQIQKEYEEAVASQKNSAPWAIRYSTSPCPYCGHYKVRSAKWEDKSLSVAFWGIASAKLGTNYKCEHCNHMWE